MLESDSEVLDSDLWDVPRPSPVEDCCINIPARERKDGLGDREEGLAIVLPCDTREGENDKWLSAWPDVT